MPTANEDAWHWQWAHLSDEDRSLFDEWIAPATIDDFVGKHVLEGGCGGGQHTGFVAPVAASVTAVDLNTTDIAAARNTSCGNIEFVRGDLATIDLGRQYDVVLSIGVVHHTDDPDATFENLYRHLVAGGKMIIWVYAAEGNALVRFGVEPVRRLLLQFLPKPVLLGLSRLATAGLYLAVYSVYRLRAFHFLPYFEYFEKFRQLSFNRNTLNVFDKLNAPQTKFISAARAASWFNEERFVVEDLSVRYHRRVSYSLVGTKRSE